MLAASAGAHAFHTACDRSIAQSGERGAPASRSPDLPAMAALATRSLEAGLPKRASPYAIGDAAGDA
jgi:hypothetical protein